MIQTGTVEFPTYGYFPGAFASVADRSPVDFQPPYQPMTRADVAALGLGALDLSFLPSLPAIPGLPETVGGVPTTWAVVGLVGALVLWKVAFSGGAQERRRELAAARSSYRQKRAAILSSHPRLL